MDQLTKDTADVPIKQVVIAKMGGLHSRSIDSLPLFLGNGDAWCEPSYYGARKVGICFHKLSHTKVKITLEERGSTILENQWKVRIRA